MTDPDVNSTLAMDSREQTQPKSSIWIALLAPLCFALMGCGFLLNRHDDMTFFYYLGYYIVHGLIIGAIFHFFVGSRCSRRVQWLCIILILLSLPLGSYLATVYNVRNMQTAANSINRRLHTISNSTNAPEQTQIEPSSAPPPRPSVDPAVEIQRISAEYMDRISSITRQYQISLDAIGWPRLLEPQRLATDVTFIESKTMIKRAKAVFETYKREFLLATNSLPDAFASSQMPEEYRREALTGFHNAQPTTNARVEEILQLEEECLLQLENVINLLAARGDWDISEGKILFARPADAERFNDYLQRVNVAVARQQALREQSLRQADNVFQNLAGE